METLTLHDTARTWISHLEFYGDDLAFLNNLLNRYYNDLVAQENLDEIRELMIWIQDTRRTIGFLSKAMKKHKDNLVLSSEKKTERLGKNHLKNHENLQKKLKDFKIKFSSLRKETFDVADRLFGLEKEEKLFFEREEIKEAHFCSN